MSGPCGGCAGATRVIGKGQRRLMTKGIKMGSWVAVSYRVPIKQEIDENDTGHYEGKIVDKRIGGQDRESFIELKDVLKVDIDGNVIGKEKNKRLIDAFIEDCKVIEKRAESWDEIKLSHEAEVEARFRAARKEAGEDEESGSGMMGMMPGMMMMQNMMQGMMAASMMQNAAMMGGMGCGGCGCKAGCGG
eukprot:CAMPEP_0181404288 /NCGR_PEP_ID=MMETSP1110-20121109/4162_1 /TAXON_ID=174948 /ORGANISM="Symbiodinium sp., Strain CCMP421" /LENGTH=189 /DNA_ID=CAMNT_0023526631 /DNA_START=51 /DNA_END=616 /DNA_ORIENTATION=-